VQRILFICTGNTCRSPMAQALFIRMLLENKREKASEYEILSAGLFASEGISATPAAIETMLEYNIDLSQHKSKQINKQMVNSSDYIFTMTGDHCKSLIDMFPESAEKTFLLGDFAGYQGTDVFDPYGMGVNIYRECAAGLKDMLQKIVEKMSQ